MFFKTLVALNDVQMHTSAVVYLRSVSLTHLAAVINSLSLSKKNELCICDPFLEIYFFNSHTCWVAFDVFYTREQFLF